MDEHLNTYITGVAHTGIAVPDILAAEAQYALLGFVRLTPEIVKATDHGVQALMMRNGDAVIELISPLEEGVESPVDAYIETKPYKMYHIAYYVSDFDAQIELLKKNKFILTGEPKESPLQKGKRTAFMGNRKLGVIELVEV